MDSSQRVRAMLSFVQAAERGSLAAAARALGISAAAVSKNVAGLERALGIRLMNRTTRSLQLTAEGSVFLEHARVAIDALDHAIDTVAAQRADPVGRIRISSGHALGRTYLMPLMSDLIGRYPGLVPEIDLDDYRVDIVKDGYDLVLRGGLVGDSSLISRRICALHVALVASPSYLKKHGIPKRRDDLHSHRKIAVRFLNGGVSRWMFNGVNGQPEEHEPDSPALIVSSPEAAAQAALHGIGIAQVGIHHVWEDLRKGRLKVLFVGQHHNGGRELVLQYPHRALIAPRVRVTVEFLLERFSKIEALHASPRDLRAYGA